MRGSLMAPANASLRVLQMPTAGRWSLTFWMCGLTVDQPMHSFCVTAKTVLKTALLTSIWRAPTNTVVGSIHHCCKAVAPMVVRRTAEF